MVAIKSAGGRGEARRVSEVVPGRRIPSCLRDARPGLGEDGDLLPVPERTLEAPADEEVLAVA